MPIRKKISRSMSLMEIFSDYNPKLMVNGQIRMECPFTDEHTDGSGKFSFFVTPEINAYHCFSCKKSGNLARLLSSKFSIGYFEALELVNFSTVEKKEKSFELDISWNINAPNDFRERGFTVETLNHFKIGTTEKGWMVIPFYNDFSSVSSLVGYQLRKNAPDRQVKNNEGFDKQHYLYNLDTSYDYVIVVEGYSDVMRLYQHGYNAAGLLGADISAWQAEQISKFEHVYLALDNDDAGRKATEICYHLLKNHTDVKLIPYTTKDPGECLSKKMWSKAFSQSTDYADYSVSMAMYMDGYIEMRDKIVEIIKKRNYDY